MSVTRSLFYWSGRREAIPFGRAYSRGHSTSGVGGGGVGGLSPNSILENGVSSNIIWCLYFEANYQLLPWVHVVFSPAELTSLCGMEYGMSSIHDHLLQR